jgi:hypothetical protein
MSSDRPTPPLDLLQRWMQGVLMHPGGAVAGVESASSRKLLNVSGEHLDSVISPSRALTSLERLEIYARAYYARLLECLRTEFPMCVRAVGEAAFDQLALEYLQHYPSRSYTLNRLGENFPRFLEETRPPVEAGGGDWPSLLVELAELEWAMGEVFDGPGLEGSDPGDFSALERLAPEEFGRCRLLTSPSLRLLSFQFPVSAYWEQLKRGGEVVPPAAQPTWLALVRVDYIVRRHHLSEPEFLILRRLQSGGSVVEAIAAGAESLTGDPSHLASQLRQWFGIWRRGRLVTGLQQG